MKEQLQVQSFDKASFKAAIESHLTLTYGQQVKTASTHYWYLALCKALSETTIVNQLSSLETIQQANCKSVNYFSLEFLIGRLTGNNLINLGIYDQVNQAVSEMGLNLVDLIEQERDPALGNGGLGRLAACYLDSLATQKYPAVGYGLHYQYGLFKQSFADGHQVESPDKWRSIAGYPWEILRADLTQTIGFMGHVEVYTDTLGQECRRWVPGLRVNGVAWDIPVLGFKNNYSVPLRLWECQAIEPFNFAQFNQGDLFWAHSGQVQAQNVTDVLYPNDQHQKGKMLRLSQQYFLCACSLGDMIQRHLAEKGDIETLADFETVQLNDTHPAIAIPELMRLLMDQYQLGWHRSWQITTKLFAYTNHTLLPEALECWSATLIGKLLPRHLEIINEINRRFLLTLDKKWPDDQSIKNKLSIISVHDEPMVNMANLSVVSSYAVNGVAQIHSELVKRDLFPEFNHLYPNRLCNVTNGVTPRRWLVLSNPNLSKLISSKIGDNWQTNLNELEQLVAYADDEKFQADFHEIKQQNKKRLADWVYDNMGIELNLNAIFDVHIKRLHEYKRQHLNLLHILSLYYRLLHCPDFEMNPRVFIFAAKAAPAYSFAKEIIFAINKVAEKVNNDSRLKGKLKVVFLEDYRVSLAELIIPAADVSEQISTAGKEASGTGNMKLALNGAVTIGTLDGANVEILEEVGEDNIFIFGLTVHQVTALQVSGYRSRDYFESDKLLQSSLALLDGEEFTPGEPGRLRSISQNLLQHGDPYLVLADFDAYIRAQQALDNAYSDKQGWRRKAILNTALMGKFSSDRSIRDYAEKIWNIEPLA